MSEKLVIHDDEFDDWWLEYIKLVPHHCDEPTYHKLRRIAFDAFQAGREAELSHWTPTFWNNPTDSDDGV